MFLRFPSGNHRSSTWTTRLRVLLLCSFLLASPKCVSFSVNCTIIHLKVLLDFFYQSLLSLPSCLSLSPGGPTAYPSLHSATAQVSLTLVSNSSCLFTRSPLALFHFPSHSISGLTLILIKASPHSVLSNAH